MDQTLQVDNITKGVGTLMEKIGKQDYSSFIIDPTDRFKELEKTVSTAIPNFSDVVVDNPFDGN